MFTFADESWFGIQFGLGVMRTQTPNGALIGMDGGSAGGSATMRRPEGEDLNVVVLLNLSPDDGATDRIRDAAITAVLAVA
jgi:hypothetical protein